MYNPTKPYKHQILKLIESTWNTPYVKVERGLYPIFKKRFSSWEVQHTDGIGTKGLYHWRKRNIAMTGGETSIHSDSHGMDISITVSAFLKRRRKNQCRVGDVLIGLPSSGLHSNGITKVRELFGKQYRKEFTEPTKIYLDSVLSVLDTHKVNGMMHITGGAFTKLKDILGKADAVLSHDKRYAPKIFRDIYAKGVPNKVMYSTFNCGVGFILSVPQSEVKSILLKLKKGFVLGEVTKGNGTVHIISAFSDRKLVL